MHVLCLHLPHPPHLLKMTGYSPAALWLRSEGVARRRAWQTRRLLGSTARYDEVAKRPQRPTRRRSNQVQGIGDASSVTAFAAGVRLWSSVA